MKKKNKILNELFESKEKRALKSQIARYEEQLNDLRKLKPDTNEKRNVVDKQIKAYEMRIKRLEKKLKQL